MKQTVIILGSTGSIGKQTLEVVAANPDRFELIGISAFRDSDLLRRQAKEFSPRYIACAEHPDRTEYPDTSEIFAGDDASERLAGISCDILILAISGFAALKPLLIALHHATRIAIANKESLVCGGALVTREVESTKTELVPIDSEQSAIFQCLMGGKKSEVKRLILTASGGPFFRKTREELEHVKISDVLAHPTWNMGRKITLDSATLFNKGLEVMEASRLFGFSGEQIGVLVHPQSIVHSMVEFIDHTVIANLAVPDMRLPIQYAMTYPNRTCSLTKPLDLAACRELTFFNADFVRFPALRLAYEALSMEQGLPIVYNGANEMAAELYFAGEIRFLDIERCVDKAMQAYQPKPINSVEAIYEADAWSRAFVKEYSKTIR